MGSAGSGSFGNYPGKSSKTPGGNGSGVGGGFGGEVEAPEIIENVKLEDVATSEYYIQHENVPGKGEKVSLRTNIVEGRLVVELTETHEIIGNLPTEYNYLRGLKYHGTIVSSGLTPIPYIVVNLHG